MSSNPGFFNNLENIAQRHQRFFDVPSRIDNSLHPIEGYGNVRLQSLDEAVEPIENLVNNVKYYSNEAARSIRLLSSTDLPTEQIMAIILYTMEWEPQNQCLYFVLNATLRDGDRAKLRPWFPYLKLLLTGLFQLKSMSDTVYRGVKRDFHEEYPIGRTIIWWAFSSCTSRLETLESDNFLGQNGPRTMFIIKCFTGKDISKYSCFSHEAEVLLLPGTKLVVEGCVKISPECYMIQLKEIPSSNRLLQYIQESIDTFFGSRINEILFASNEDVLDLENRNINNRDLAAVCRMAQNNTHWTGINLKSNRITLDGAVYIGQLLQINETLTTIDLSKNKLADFGVTNIAHGLKTNLTIKKLILSSNQVTDIGVETLVEMLYQNNTIEVLDLSSNDIGDAGFYRLSGLLTTNNYIKKLYLSSNRLTDDIINSLIQMLNINHSLSILYLEGNQLSESGKSEIRLEIPLRSNFVLSL